VLRRILWWAGIAYVIYLAFCVLVLLPALNILPARYVEETYGRRLTSEIILFNPFSLSLEARRVELPERNGEPFAGLEKASVDLSLQSLWQPGLVLDRFHVDQFHLHLHRLADGTLNVADLLPPETEEPETEEDGEIPGITVHDLRFHARQIRLSDDSREPPFSTRFDDLLVAVRELSTVLEEGKPYRIDAYGEGEGHLRWEGEISVPGQYSHGNVALSNIELETAWRLLEPWVAFRLADGRLDLGGDYSLDWRDEVGFQVSGGSLRLSRLALAPKIPEDLPGTGVGLAALEVTGIAVDGTRQHVAVDSVAIAGPSASGWMEGERISLAELFAPAGGDAAEEPEDPNGIDAGPAWTAEVNMVRLTDGRLDWRSAFTDPPDLAVGPIEARLDRLRWPLEGSSGLGLSVTVNDQARAAIDGSLALASGDGEISYTLEGLPLAWFNPNLPDQIKAEVTAGHLTLDGRTWLEDFAPARLQGTGSVTGFAGAIEGEEASLTSWETVRWEELEVDLAGRSVSLQRLIIDNYSGRLHIREDGTVNAQKIWQEEVGEQAAELAEDLELTQPWEISLPVVRISDSQIDFMDESLPIRFRTVIGDLNGEVLGISTRPGAAAEVDLQGSVDGYAPVALSGTAEPLSQPPALDLSLTFDGVDMALLSPYSGTYAGYKIERGLLNLDLKYAVSEGRLKGDNSVVVKQLKLGEPVDSDKALDLPLELALALLTDVNGVIDLAVPVSGDLDDPKFDIGSVIAGAFVNLLTKAVTAPFALLASLVGSEEDLQRVNFASGSSTLDEAAKARLGELGSALSQRPGLTLVIMGRLHPEADVKKLQEQQLSAELVAAGVSPEQVESKGPDWEKAIGERYAGIATADAAEATIGQQFRAVRDRVQVPPAALEELMEARAVAVKTFLVNTAGLSADRAVIQQVAADDPANQLSGVELDIDT
jgi:hypothetical protein